MHKQNIGIFGGSFNPVHYGHMDVVEQLLKKDLFDAIWFLPCGVHPGNKELVDSLYRIKMLEFAVSGMDCSRIGISHVESGSKKNYTYDTINTLVTFYPNVSFNIIIGSDQLRKVKHWYNGEKLLSNFQFMTFLKFGDSLNFEDKSIIEKYSIQIVDVNPRDISSSKIRDKLSRGESIESHVPPNVNSYIQAQRLYH
ncbi:MAG: nicotinate (nicotinamide) nucleotide adenylyltransferase [Candidatus Woesearchaeota archaeon]